MLWSPVVKGSRDSAKYNQEKDILRIVANITATYGIDIELVINEKFLRCLNELRSLARVTTEELKCPALRLLQIEETLKKRFGTKG
jgi:hypothetical protein